MTTAALLIIGDEILTGKVVDENSPWLITQLREMGVEIRCVMVVPDAVDLIADHLRALCVQVDYVFTSGGLGPTHDDRTMEAVGLAVGQALAPNADLTGLVRSWLEGKPGSAWRLAAMERMCLVPTGAVLHRKGDRSFPLVTVENIIVLPGVPHLLRKKFELFRSQFDDDVGPPSLGLRLESTFDETEFAVQLAAIQERWADIGIGSYPRRTADGWVTTITLDGRDRDRLEACASEIRAMLCELES